MSVLFCCDSIKPYRPQYISHEEKFTTFMKWASYPKEVPPNEDKVSLDELKTPFVIQLVRQVNYGSLESRRYFARVKDQDEDFVEVDEDALIQANFQKLNSYKNFKCEGHDKFFEVNVYQKDPLNKHHWRINVARPGSTIDLGGK
ncbi:hypothetical protein F4809DRAFT_614630 [Biscogniauxia mediterranea]|nr:hypothetical protein F4809DRAFT_614630 [Biscogniauxia mediterranea]